jgi:hypothetical protein
MKEQGGRTAFFSVRVWHEEGADGRMLRARIVQTLDAADPGSAETFALSTSSDIVSAVQAFLARAAPVTPR